MVDRRSVAVFPSQGSGQPVQDYSPTYYPAAATNTAAGQTPFEDLSYFHPPPAPAPATAPASSGPSRSHTVALRDHRGRGSKTTSPALDRADTPSSLWSPGFQPLPSPSEQEEIYSPDAASMHSNTTPGKTSSESGSATGLDRWSQRRLQRLNTEQGFREQRQGGGVGGGGVLSPPPSDHVFAQPPEAQPQPLHQQSQPPTFYPASRSGSNAGLGLQTQLNSNNNNTHSRPSLNYQHDAAQQQQQQQTHQTQQQQQPQYSPPDTSSQFSSPGSGRPNLQQTRSFSQQAAAAAEADSMSASNSSSINNNGSIAAPKAVRSAAANRQSLHNDMLSRDTSNMSQQGVPSFSASVVPSASQAQPYKSDQTSQTQSDPRRPTPQPLPTGEDMSEEGVTQLIKDHKELREYRSTRRVDGRRRRRHVLTIHRRREIHQGQEVLLRKGRPGQAATEQPRSSATVTITHLARRQRVHHSFQSARRTHRATGLQHSKELAEPTVVAGQLGQQGCRRDWQARDDRRRPIVHLLLARRGGL